MFPIHHDYKDSLPLYILAYGGYALMFGVNLFLAIHTEHKLFLAPLWHGLSFLVIGITLIVVVCFSQWAHGLGTIVLIAVVYVLLLLAGGCFFQAARLPRSWGNRKTSVSIGIAGGSFGYILAHFLNPILDPIFGDTGWEIFLLVSAAIFSVLFGIVGVNYMVKYFLLKTGRFRNIEWFD